MPASAPPSGPKLKKILREIGGQIRARRKLLKISAIATAESAGVSRMTLNRIEAGESSVTIGAYINVISVLGLKLSLLDLSTVQNKIPHLVAPEKIRIADYPQLKRLAWQLKETAEVTAEEALAIYERNWKHVEQSKMSVRERQLIQALLAKLGRKGLLV